MSVSSLKTCYLSGPMTGLPDFNYPYFNKVAALWRAKGFIVNNPAENFGGRQDLPMLDYMRRDLVQVIDSDFMVMLPGWANSKGANVEAYVATHLGKPFWYHIDNLSVPDEFELRKYLCL